MTLSAESNADGSKPGSGRALALTGIGATGIDPFIASLDDAPTAPRPWHANLLDYSAHAAMIVGLIGFAWTVSGHVVKRDTSDIAPQKLATVSPPAPAPRADEIGDLRRANRQMAADIKVLHASLDNLRGAIAKERAADQIRALSASVEDVRTGLTAAKSETIAQIEQLSGKLDKLQHEPTAKGLPASPHVAKLDTTTTASIPSQTEVAKSVPVPPVKPSNLAEAEDAATKDANAKPQVIAGWVVRDVYQGVALIEGRRGSMEIVPGVSVPGAGIVKSIERHGSGWTVTTTKGLLAYAAPQRDYRRAQSRDYYPDYRYDF